MTRLPNGLRVITDMVPDMHSVAVGVWVGVGTRDEDMKVNGVAHMTEHMLFKGTTTRNAQEIAEIIENVGGNVNAYTSREITSYHIHLMKENLPLALDILSDMIKNSTLPQDEIEREREVILQEIGMCNDTPDDLVFDNYYETAYPDQAFGAPILGRHDIISRMDKDSIASYIGTFYSPARMVISAAGNLDHAEFVRMVGEMFTDLPRDKTIPRPAAAYKGGDMRLNKELEQSHIVLGFEGLSRLDPEYYNAHALAAVLGGGMSSRLFQEVREKRGLVYSVYAFHSGYIDSGQFAIYAGTGPDKLTELVPVVCEQILKAADGITAAELDRAKAQIKAGMLMGRESMMTRADQQAKYLIYRDQVFNLDEAVRRIENITQDGIRKTAQQIFKSKPTLSALGPLQALEPYEKIVEKMAA
jgi:predicted Zn-dependent peptidase